MPEGCKELKFKIENFLVVNQVCPLRVRPREREIIFFSFRRRGVFQIKANTLTIKVKCGHLVPEPDSR